MFIQKTSGKVYTKKDFGLDLRNVLHSTQDPYKISHLISHVYNINIFNTELEVEKVAFALECMQDGEEFHYTNDELYQIADELIRGQYPKLLK